jgi:1-deoxy-D-xylulose-5-phosphate reductoisomerase
VSRPPARALTILGATGSVGASTLDVVTRHAPRFRVIALSGNTRWQAMLEACKRVQPRYAAMLDPVAAGALQAGLRRSGLGTEVLSGPDGLEAIATLPEVDAVMAAIVGAAGLRPTLAAARAGKRVLLANKEALVMAGRLFMDAVRVSGAPLLPIDSEHNAVMQCLPADYAGSLRASGVRRILLTASGGPLRNTPLAELAKVTPAQACAHPNWVMGRKISVDSATMMNKGLELIEAHWLFAAPAEQIEVVIHPQSVIHSMVEYVDGSVIAQLGNPDMRTPIAHALAFPERMESGARQLNFLELGSLHFEQPDLERFPCLALAHAALKEGGSAPVVMNAANEVAVEQFLNGKLAFDRIAPLIEEVADRVRGLPVERLDQVLEADRCARQAAREQLARQPA